MTNKIISKEKTGSIILFILYGSGLMLFISAVLYPRYKLLIQKDFDIIALKNQISDQRELIPRLAMKMQEAELSKLPEYLMVPNKMPLTQEESEKLPFMLEELARRYRLKAESIVSEADSGGGETVFLSVNTTRQNGRDNFSELYLFLMELEKTAYTERIERVSIQAVHDIKKIDIRIRLVRK